MEKRDIEELKERVLCAAVLEQAGFAIDLRESTEKAVKYRRGDEIIIVIHAGRGWFDPLSDAKGDVFGLAEHVNGVRFSDALDEVAGLIDFTPTQPVWKRPPRTRQPDLSVPQRWQARRRPWRGSMTWRYLVESRCIPDEIVRAALRQDRLREGPRGSMWACHTDMDGLVCGWEERGPHWRGYATGGAKVLFRLGRGDALRLCVTEAAIDAMSLATFEHLRRDSLYLSTGGGWSPRTDTALRDLALRRGTLLLAATDRNAQGAAYARRLEAIAEAAGCRYDRILPTKEDWNEDLRTMTLATSGGSGLPVAHSA